MRHFIILFTLLITFNFYANNEFGFDLPENHKLEATYSADLKEKGSIHLLITKEKGEKYFYLIPYYISKNGDFKELKTTQLSNIPSIISHHYDHNVFTITSYNKEKKALTIIDINTSDGSSTLHQEINFPNITSLFRLDNRTVIINKKNKYLFVKEIKTISSNKSYKIDIPKDKLKLYKLITKENATPINQNEYVEKGAISNRKVYISGSNITFTYENSIINTTEVMKIDYINESINLKSFGFSNNNKFLNFNTFIKENKLYTISSNKEDLVINLINLETEKVEKSISLNENLKDIYSESESFLKNAKKGKMKPTLTVNKTKDENLLIRIDQVNQTSYQYNHDWWFHHWWFHQQMMWQQQQMIQNQQQQMINSIPNGFGPNPEIYYNINNIIEDIVPIEFVINQEFEILKNASNDTKHSNIDKSKYIEPIEKDKDITNISISFSDTEMKYVYQNKKDKKVYIKTVDLDNN